MAPSSLFRALLGLLCIGTVLGDVVHFQHCPDSEEGEAAALNCVVNEVRVNPCAEAAENKPCKVKRGKHAEIAFDLTPGADAETAETRAFWAHSEGDLPFVGMNTNACDGTSCPIHAGTQQTYNYNLEISKKFPVRSYDVKWKLWNEEANLRCCFIIKIKLVK